MGRRFQVPHLGNKAQKLADILASDADAIYLRIISQWQESERLLREGCEPPHLMNGNTPFARRHSIKHWQYLDTLTYLPDDILTKVDRASMAVSLEVRMPILDHRVVELAWRLPEEMRLRQGRSKWILRRVLSRFVPDHLVERPKMGFGVPIGVWLKGPLREWATDLLSTEALEAGDLFDPELIRKTWDDHLSGRANCEYPLWTILMFQSWRRNVGL